MDLLNQCDFYLKRSYSAEKNRIFGYIIWGDCDGQTLITMYLVLLIPIDKPYWKELIKNFFEIDNNMYSNTLFQLKSLKKFQSIKVKKSKFFLQYDYANEINLFQKS